MSLSLGDAARVLEMERRIDALEASIDALEAELTKLQDFVMDIANQSEVEKPRRGRPPKNLEERMKNQERDPIDPYANAVSERNSALDAE